MCTKRESGITEKENPHLYNWRLLGIRAVYPFLTPGVIPQLYEKSTVTSVLQNEETPLTAGRLKGLSI